MDIESGNAGIEKSQWLRKLEFERSSSGEDRAWRVDVVMGVQERSMKAHVFEKAPQRKHSGTAIIIIAINGKNITFHIVFTKSFSMYLMA